MNTVRSVSVVVPARNEESLIERCLSSVFDSIRYAHRALGPRVPHTEVIVVADGCEDATARLARSSGAAVVAVNAGNVGSARATGAMRALERGRGMFAEHWIANTDADSVVPSQWLVDQIAIADRGYDGMIGTVRPDFDDLTAEQIELWRSTHLPGSPNGHVHGANLGVRADAYLAAGGFRHAAESEDNDLVDRLVARGARLLATDECEVMTSGRQLGRTPGGYAGFLRDQLTTMRVPAAQ